MHGKAKIVDVKCGRVQYCVVSNVTYKAFEAVLYVLLFFVLRYHGYTLYYTPINLQLCNQPGVVYVGFARPNIREKVRRRHN